MSHNLTGPRTAVIALSAAGLSLAAVVPGVLRSGGHAGTGPVAAPAAAATAPQNANWYLALGDSLGAGYQPGRGDDKAGGYVGHVRDAAATQVPGIKLNNLSCSGEDTVSMTSGSRRCNYPEGSQLKAAEAFLKKQGTAVRLVTIDLGANDVQRCARGTDIDMSCLSKGMSDVNTNLPAILQRLRSAAPDAKIVVLNYYNPFLATWLLGEQGQGVARLSQSLQAGLNGAISSAATKINASVADVATGFASTDWTQKQTPLGALPTNVAAICAQTWMCSKADIHANDAGYATMGRITSAAVGTLTPATPTPEPSSPSPTSSRPTEPEPTQTRPTEPAPSRPSGPAPSTPRPAQPTGPLVQTG